MPPAFFFLASLWALWVEKGGAEQKTHLLQFEELRLPHFLGRFMLQASPAVSPPEHTVSISGCFQVF